MLRTVMEVWGRETMPFTRPETRVAEQVHYTQARDEAEIQGVGRRRHGN